MNQLNTDLYGGSLLEWGVALAALAITFAILHTVQRLGLSRLQALAAKTATHWDDLLVEVLGKTKSWALLAIALYVGTRFIDLPGPDHDIVLTIVLIVLLVQTGMWAITGINGWLRDLRNRQLARDPSAVTSLSALGFLAKLVVWTIVLLLALDNLGVDITALVAGLGITGIAVALAVQNVLGDVFASLSIVLDKPFVLGDFLAVGEHLGSVEYIGLKTTRMRSLSGEQLVFANSDLLSSRIRNYGRMFERRVAFTIGVTYQTPREKLELIPNIIREAIEARDQIRFDRSHFKEHGDFALKFENVYYVLGPDYNLYMDIQQAINLDIHERFEREGIEFAYPTQTIFVAREAA